MLKYLKHSILGLGVLLLLNGCCFDGCSSSFLSETNNYPYTAASCCADGCGGSGANCCNYQSNDWW